MPAKDWRNLFKVNAAGLAVQRGILARPGKRGYLGNLQLPLFPGRYEAVLRVERTVSPEDSAGKIVITAGKDVLASREIGFTAPHFGPIAIPRKFRFCSFEVSGNDVCKTRIGVVNTGGGAFLIRSISIRPRTRLHDIRDRARIAAQNYARWLRGAFESPQPAK